MDWKTPFSALNAAASLAVVLVVMLAGAPRPATAQGVVTPPPSPEDDTVTAAPSPRYEAGGLVRWLFGDDWRTQWQTPVLFRVLDIETFAGGLEPQEEGGNMQSITLHMEDPEGREWIFRSIDKYPGRKSQVGGLVGQIAQDQVSALHPAGQLAIPPLLDALGILHVQPTFYIMPDDPALGEFRETFAGMVGALELQPNEGPDDTPGFAGSSLITASDRMLERLEESPIHAVDQRELLRARLLDFIIGDPDRGTDQWRWARFPHPDPVGPERYLWRPIPRDRDWAFVSGDGAFMPLVRTFYPKLVEYGPEHAATKVYVFSSHIVDRAMLTKLSRRDFMAQVDVVQERLTDDVIERAVQRLPERYSAEHRRRLAENMKARREALEGAAADFYAWLAQAVDIWGTDLADRAEIVRRPDGAVDVTLSLQPGQDDLSTEPYYRRTFLPSETNEVRVFLFGDDDVAVVRGGSDAIPIRVIGGGSDDVLADSSGAGSVHFYDARGDNEFVTARGTTVDLSEWSPPPAPEGIRLGSDWAPDYGDDFGWAPVLDYQELGGVVLGFGPVWTDYGFRRLPYHWQVSVAPLFATMALDFGLQATAAWRPENSLHSFETIARWSRFDAIRWFGLGNQTDEVHDDLSAVPLERVSVDPAIVLRFGAWRAEAGDEEISTGGVRDETPRGFRAALAVGPTFTYTDADPEPASPYLTASAPTGSDRPVAESGVRSMWQSGARAVLDARHTDSDAAPRTGFHLLVSGEGYPGWDNVETGSFGEANAELSAYLPLPLRATLAARAGGRGAFGDFPAWNAAAIGGRADVRGFEFMRFAGDAAAYGNAELRVPLFRADLLVRGDLGILGLADAGRVWVDDDSPGGWHTAFGAGLWFSAPAQTFSVYWARGEGDHVYVSLGMPF